MVFSKLYLFLRRHFEINSVLLFNKFLWSALTVTYFSVKHRSHLLDPNLEAQAATLHFTLKLMYLSCSFQMCFENSMSCSWYRWRNEFVWLLQRDLNSPSLAPSRHDCPYLLWHQPCKRYSQNAGLSITIETNLFETDFLDVTFNLATGNFFPFRKPKNQPLYINTKSNHPPTIIRDLPNMINKRLSELSCNEKEYEKAKPLYDTATEHLAEQKTSIGISTFKKISNNS